MNSAVAQMHKLKVMDPVTGKKSKIAHGDLRPTNILVREGKLGEVRWEVKFVDFDWACYDGSGLQRFAAVCRTTHSPEARYRVPISNTGSIARRMARA